MIIRKAQTEELAQLLEIYAWARGFMRENGNPCQWGNTHPTKNAVQAGIAAGRTFLCAAEGFEKGKNGKELMAGELLGVFYFAVEEEPSYKKIYEGRWLNEKPYGVIHQVAASGRSRGFAKTCFDWAGRQCQEAGIWNLKIDTHQDNHVMQHVLEKNGFVRCGTIRLADGTKRLAYQKLLRYPLGNAG